MGPRKKILVGPEIGAAESDPTSIQHKKSNPNPTRIMCWSVSGQGILALKQIGHDRPA